MKNNKRNLIALVIFLVILFIAFASYQVWFLDKAHSTFENYYSFRGCVKLVDKTSDFGLCQTASGQTIKIVKFNNKWYLDGDLPCGFLCF